MVSKTWVEYDWHSEVSGGFINFIVGSGVGVGMYAFKQHLNEQPMTIGGAATVAAFGAITGGLAEQQLERLVVEL